MTNEWKNDAACDFWSTDVDLSTVDHRSSADEVDAARAVCIGCPVLVQCRQWALRADVSGMCGAMTEAERKVWQARHHLHPSVVDLIDVTPAHQLTATILAGLPSPGQGDLHPRVREVVVRMTHAGLTADDIVTRLDRSDVTHRTVNYLRRTYMKGWARVDA